MRSNSNNPSQTLVLIVPGEGKSLYPLTRRRPQPLVPFGGEFHIIDFTLWNCLNSDFRKVFVLPDHQAGAVVRYFDSLDWGGEIISVYPDPHKRYGGTADALFHNLGLLQLEAPKYVLVLLTDHIYEMDFGKLLEFHTSHADEITVVTHGIADIGVYLFNASAFRRALLREALRAGNSNLSRYVICRSADECNIRTYDLTSNARASSTYWGGVDTLDRYYQTQFRFCGTQDGDRRIISPSVEIAPTASIRNSIMLRGAQIGRGAHIRKAIIEEDVRIPDEAIIGFDEKEDRRRFVVSERGVVIVDQEGVARIEDRAWEVILPQARTA